VNRSVNSTVGLCLGLIALMVSWTESARAQTLGPSGSGMSFGAQTGYYGAFGVGTYFGGGPSYIPFGGAMGGFIPYSAGPGGGLGVQPGMRGFDTRMQSPGMGMPDVRPGLGLIRGEMKPIVPIGLRNTESRGGGGTGSMGGLFRPVPSGGVTPRMARPPVGNYPFRQPPRLLGSDIASSPLSM
jgi:hypothetical protein